MAAIKPFARIVAKWAEQTPARAAEYEEGIRSPVRDWQANATAAAEAWEAGVTEAAAQDRFAAGVARAGTQKWQRKALELGTRRWPEGVRAAVDDYRAGFEPYARVIEGVALPPRGPKGDPRNIDRVRAIATALHEAKVRGGGS